MVQPCQKINANSTLDLHHMYCIVLYCIVIGGLPPRQQGGPDQRFGRRIVMKLPLHFPSSRTCTLLSLGSFAVKPIDLWQGLRNLDWSLERLPHLLHHTAFQSYPSIHEADNPRVSRASQVTKQYSNGRFAVGTLPF